MSLLNAFWKWVDHEIGLDNIDFELEKGWTWINQRLGISLFRFLVL